MSAFTISQFSGQRDGSNLKMVAEASELGLAPGFFPPTIAIGTPEFHWHMHRTNLTEAAATYVLPGKPVTATILND